MVGQVAEIRSAFRHGQCWSTLAVLLVLGGVIPLIGGAALYLWYERGAAIMVDFTTFFCG
ncbi:MAG: hypothetical protein EXQ99_03135 [Alphaproteobacteria bacterium]|nr:hypothetical protein [Alphaproteobacteria bacterium]